MKKRRTKTKRNGSKLVTVVFATLLALGCVLAKDKKSQEPYSIVGGTVFRDPGFALPGAEVTITPKLADGSQIKLKITHVISDDRGEFAFRVPPTAAKYTVKATARGFRSDEKITQVDFEGERVDVTFLLEPESK